VTTPGPDVSQVSVAIAEAAIATLTVPGYVDFLAADGRAVWATNIDRVEKFEVDRPDPVATVAMPSPCGAMVVAYGSLWVASCKDLAIYRIDRETRTVVARIPTGLADPTGELSLAAGAEAIWVLSSAEGTLSRIDAASNEVVARIPVLPQSYSAAFADGAVWISNTGSVDRLSPGSVQRIDPLTNRVAATVRTGPVPSFIAAGEGAVWTLNWGDGSMTKVNSVDNRPEVTIPLGMEGGGGDIATGGGRVWIRGTKVLLASLDPSTNSVTAVYGPPAGSGAVRVADDLVWVTAHDTNTIWVLQPDRQGDRPSAQ
jgi:DNA-binding beta-propeller fold protein YncE